MERKEPYASQEEYNKQIIHYEDTTAFNPHPSVKAHIVSSEKMTIALLTINPNTYVPVHKHENEQIMIATEGALDLVIDGKLYPFKKGDVVIFSPNLGHGGYVSDEGYSGIDVFYPPRQDFIAKIEEVKKSQRK